MPETPRATAFSASRTEGPSRPTGAQDDDTTAEQLPQQPPAPAAGGFPPPRRKPAPSAKQPPPAPATPVDDGPAPYTQDEPAPARPAPQTPAPPPAHQTATPRGPQTSSPVGPAARERPTQTRPAQAPQQSQRPVQQQLAPHDAGPSQYRDQGDGTGDHAIGDYSNGLFDDATATKQVSQRPKSGFRSALYDLTGGRMNLGRGKSEIYRDGLIHAVQGEIPGPTRHIMVWSQKGGVGKTTTAVQLGITLAGNRTDKVLGLDVNPDGGSMAVRVPMTTRKNILDLRNALAERPLAPTDFDGYVNHAAHRFDTITMPPGAKPRYPLTGEDYAMIADALRQRYPYKLVITDCGTNLTDSVMGGVRARADMLVVVTTTNKDEAKVTAGGLAAMVRDGQGDLVSNAITVLVEKTPRSVNVDDRKRFESTAAEIRDYFGRHTQRVISVPYDPVIQAGEVLDAKTYSAATELAHLEVASSVVRTLASTHPRQMSPLPPH